MQPESEHCARARSAALLYALSVGVESGSRVLTRSESAVDMCGIQGFPLIAAKCQSEDVAARKQNKALREYFSGCVSGIFDIQRQIEVRL